jgi:nitrite reductase (NADH) large subunit
MQTVIIGGSAAGIQAAEDLRKLEPQARITVISDEPHYPYSRCLISRYVEGKLHADALRFRTGRFFEQYDIDGWLGARVERIDPTAGYVELTDGRQAPYDRLLLATGSRPFVPGIPGLDLGNVFTFHSMADAEAIVAAASRAARVVVLGAGFAGLEAAYALARQGKQVTVVERMGQILPNQLDWTGSGIIQGDLESSGVRILLDNSVAAIEGAGVVSSVSLTDRSSLAADLVIVATGTRPNVELAQQAGLTTQRGIVVDAYLQTSAPGIYAAGDVIEIEDIATGRRGCSATWFNAILQGKYAASNMAGASTHLLGCGGHPERGAVPPSPRHLLWADPGGRRGRGGFRGHDPAPGQRLQETGPERQCPAGHDLCGRYRPGRVLCGAHTPSRGSERGQAAVAG